MSSLPELGLPNQYPVSCPHCQAVAGLPVAVMTVANEPRALRLDFKCGQCHHRWWQQFDAPLASTATDATATK